MPGIPFRTRRDGWVVRPGDLPRPEERAAHPELEGLENNALFRRFLQSEARRSFVAVVFLDSNRFMFWTTLFGFGPLVAGLGYLVLVRILSNSHPGGPSWPLPDFFRGIAGAVVARIVLAPSPHVLLRRMAFKQAGVASLGRPEELALARYGPRDLAAALWGVLVTERERRWAILFARLELALALLLLLLVVAVLSLGEHVLGRSAILFPLLFVLGREAPMHRRHAETLLDGLALSPLRFQHASDLVFEIGALVFRVVVAGLIFAAAVGAIRLAEMRGTPPFDDPATLALAVPFTALGLLLAGRLWGRISAERMARRAGANFELLAAKCEWILLRVVEPKPATAKRSPEAPSPAPPPALAEFQRGKRRARFAFAAVAGLALIAAIPSLNRVRHFIAGARAGSVAPLGWSRAILFVRGPLDAHQSHFLRRGLAEGMGANFATPADAGEDFLRFLRWEGARTGLRDLRLARFPPEGLDAISLPRLRQLELELLPGPASFARLRDSPELERLWITGQATAPDLSPFADLPALREFWFGLRGARDVSAALRAPALERFSLIRADDVLEVSCDRTSGTASAFAKLESLEVGSCQSVERVFVRGTPALLRLTLYRNPSLREVVVTGAPRLEAIQVLQADALESLVATDCPRLQAVIAEDCRALSRLELARNPELRTLTIRGAESLRDLSGVEPIPEGGRVEIEAPNLETETPGSRP